MAKKAIMVSKPPIKSQKDSEIPVKKNYNDLSHASFDVKADAVAQDYAKKFKGEVLRWRREVDQLVILFVDGRKFYFAIPAGWLK